MMNIMRDNKKLLTILFVIWSTVIFILTVIPSVESPLPSVTYLDKIAHIGQYFLFSLLYYLMRRYYVTDETMIVKEITVLSLILPVLTELIQILIPGRSFSLLDILANYIGFIITIVYLKSRIRSKLRLNYEEE